MIPYKESSASDQYGVEQDKKGPLRESVWGPDIAAKVPISPTRPAVRDEAPPPSNQSDR